MTTYPTRFLERKKNETQTARSADFLFDGVLMERMANTATVLSGSGFRSFRTAAVVTLGGVRALQISFYLLLNPSYQ